MSGWKYDWVSDLPPEVYEVILDLIEEERAARDNG